MEADDKPFACSFDGCNMRFTNEDHLTVHKKKHDMVLNLGNGQKTNVFVADQTPTPTRFIRNCEEVGLFQDLQNVNPFEETFRKAVEAVKTGVGPLHEVDALSEPTGTDDTLHTPHVFPHIIEDTTSNSSSAYKSVATSFISSTSIVAENGRKKSSLCSNGSTSSSPRQELDQLLHPTSTTGDSECHGEIITGDICEERRVLVQLGTSTKVVRQEADTSQQQETSRQITTASTGIKNGLGDGTLSTQSSGVTPPPALSTAGSNTVQLLLQMPDGKLLQLSALPVEHVTPSGPNNVVQPSQVDLQPVAAQSAAVVLTTTRPATATVAVPVAAVGKDKKPISAAAKTSSGHVKQPTGLSLAKLRLKQTLISNNRSAATIKESPPKQSTPKVVISEVSKTAPEAPVTRPAKVALARRASSSSGCEDAEEKRQKFLERNRAAAMRCREKRKTWIQELERRAEEMLATNQQLQLEVASLRKEVADLKTLLLAHKDCPVTQAMVQGSSVPLSSGAQAEQPQIIALPVTSNTNCMLPSAQHTTPAALVQQHPTTAPQNQLILVNGSTNHKRGSSEPVRTSKKKLSANQGMPVIRQALLLPSSPQIVNNSAVKTVTGVNKSSKCVSVAMQSGVLVTSPLITAANQLSISAVIQNSNYQQTFIVPKICLPGSGTDVERIIHGSQALSAEADAQNQRKVGEASNNELGTHVIKINPNVMRKSTDSMSTRELTTDIATSSDADSDIEIITEIGSANQRR